MSPKSQRRDVCSGGNAAYRECVSRVRRAAREQTRRTSNTVNRSDPAFGRVVTSRSANMSGWQEYTDYAAPDLDEHFTLAKTRFAIRCLGFAELQAEATTIQSALTALTHRGSGLLAALVSGPVYNQRGCRIALSTRYRERRSTVVKTSPQQALRCKGYETNK